MPVVVLAVASRASRVALVIAAALWVIWIARTLWKWPPRTWGERVECDGIGPYTVSRGRLVVFPLLGVGLALLLLWTMTDALIKWLNN